MKRFFVLLIILFSMLFVLQRNYAQEIPELQLDLRGYSTVTLPQGTFIPVINLQEISTETCPEGYKVNFESTDDLFVDDENVLPRGTMFSGYIEKINEPIVGTNASMKIKVTKLILANGYEEAIRGYIYTSNDNKIGGELTEPAEWRRMPHYQSLFQGISWNHRQTTLQVRPGGRRSMGRNIKVDAGERLIIVLTAPADVLQVDE